MTKGPQRCLQCSKCQTSQHKHFSGRTANNINLQHQLKRLHKYFHALFKIFLNNRYNTFNTQFNISSIRLSHLSPFGMIHIYGTILFNCDIRYMKGRTRYHTFQVYFFLIIVRSVLPQDFKQYFSISINALLQNSAKLPNLVLFVKQGMFILMNARFSSVH